MLLHHRRSKLDKACVTGAQQCRAGA